MYVRIICIYIYIHILPKFLQEEVPDSGRNDKSCQRHHVMTTWVYHDNQHLIFLSLSISLSLYTYIYIYNNFVYTQTSLSLFRSLSLSI